MGGGDCVLKPKLQGRELGGAALSRNQGGDQGGTRAGLSGSVDAQNGHSPSQSTWEKKSPFPKFLWAHEAELKERPRVKDILCREDYSQTTVPLTMWNW